MSIFGIVGLPGSGKSHEAVCMIVENLKGHIDPKTGLLVRRAVASNIDGLDDSMCIQQIKNLTGLTDITFPMWFTFLKKEEVTTFWIPRRVNVGTEMEMAGPPLVPPGALIVLDEVHKWVNCRDYNSDQNKRFCEWGAEHRHDGYDVMLITQSLEKLDKHVRSLIDCVYFYRKLNFLGSLGTNKYIQYYYEGSDHDGKPDAPPSNKSYRKEIFKCYKSYKAPSVIEVAVVKRHNVLKHPVFFAIPVVVGYAIYLVFHSSLASGDLFGQKARLKRVDEIKHTAAISQPIAQNAVVAVPGVPVVIPPPVAVKMPPLPPPVPVAVTLPSLPPPAAVKPLIVVQAKPVKLPKWKTIKVTAVIVVDSVTRYFSGTHDVTEFCANLDSDDMTVTVSRSFAWGVLAPGDPGYKITII